MGFKSSWQSLPYITQAHQSLARGGFAESKNMRQKLMQKRGAPCWPGKDGSTDRTLLSYSHWSPLCRGCDEEIPPATIPIMKIPGGHYLHERRRGRGQPTVFVGSMLALRNFSVQLTDNTHPVSTTPSVLSWGERTGRENTVAAAFIALESHSENTVIFCLRRVCGIIPIKIFKNNNLWTLFSAHSPPFIYFNGIKHT